jgi:heptosyltransferase III
VLVYHLGFIGDTVVSIPSLHAVRRHFGATAEICLLHEAHEDIPVSPADVLSGLGLVDRFLSYPFRPGRWGALRSALSLWVRLRRERFDAVIYLAPSERLPSAVRRDELFFRACGIRERRGFVTLEQLLEWSVRHQSTAVDERVRPEVSRKLDRLAMSGIDVSREQALASPMIRLPAESVETARRWLTAHRTHLDRELVAICPGAKNPANWWPAERFAEIGRRLLALGRFELVVIGGPSDREVAQRLLSEWGDGISAAGALPVLASAGVLSQCRFMLGLDTGMTHLAGALGVGGVALYGSRDPIGLWDPVGGLHTVVRHAVPCGGCRFTTCPLVDHPCMRGIAVADAWAALEPFWGSDGEGRRRRLLEHPERT